LSDNRSLQSFHAINSIRIDEAICLDKQNLPGTFPFVKSPTSVEHCENRMKYPIVRYNELFISCSTQSQRYSQKWEIPECELSSIKCTSAFCESQQRCLLSKIYRRSAKRWISWVQKIHDTARKIA
jgi:hypothetical protein